MIFSLPFMEIILVMLIMAHAVMDGVVAIEENAGRGHNMCCLLMDL